MQDSDNSTTDRFEIEKFLEICAAKRETEFHIEIVQPLLESIGATYLQYTHGPNERGKDFLYVMATVYGRKELHACVVKNGSFNGRANDSNSVQTALVQIQTAKDTECLNPVTQLMETPKRVLFVATHELPDKHSANLGTQLSRVAEYCEFLVADELARSFNRHCPDKFSGIVSPGSMIANKLFERLQLHSEAAVFRLPLGQQFKTFVDMRLITQCSEVLRLIDGSSRPKNVQAEYIDKRLVQFLFAYQEWLETIITLPPLISLKDRNQVAGSGNQGSRIRFESLCIGDLYDCICDLHKAATTPKDLANLPNVLFSLHDVLVLLLRHFSCFDSKSDEPSKFLGIFGPETDSTNAIAFANDNLYIVGDPGGGKSFTSQELGKRLHKAKQPVVYFPCSKVNSHQSLWSSIEDYVTETATCTIEEARAYLNTCESIIIDGLDEAMTRDSRLVAELDRLVDAERPSIEIKNDPKLQLDLLTEDIRNKVVVTKSGQNYKVEVVARLHWNEANIIVRMLFDDESDRQRSLKSIMHRRRFVVTCRQASNIELGPKFRKVKLLPFSDIELDEFVRSHCAAASFAPEDLLTFFKSHPYIHEVCKSPLTASIMLGIYLRGSRLPSSLADLYERRANLLLQEWDYAKQVRRPTEGTESQKLRLLSRVAFDLHCKRKVESTTLEIIGIARDEFKETVNNQTITAMVDDLIKHHGLLCCVGNFISFGHLSHLEFFCARHIMQRQKMAILVKEFGSPRWRNVIVFFVGLTNAANELLERAQASGKLIADPTIVQQLVAEGQASDGFAKFLLEEMQVFEDDENCNIEDAEID